jgi:hypothetical protein
LKTKIFINKKHMKISLEQLSGVVRHFLTGLGTILMVYGIIDSTTLEVLTGLLISVVSVIWSVKSKK